MQWQRQAATNVDRTIASIKREMGTAYRKKIDGKSYTPQEISAYILMKLKGCGELSWRDCERGGHHRTGLF